MDKCFLCNSKERDEVKYGEFMTREEISVHYFCLLLTSNLLQRGRDDQGFLGFLLVDIKDEASRVAPAVCCYCKKKNANISCCAPKCRKTFHLTCGVKNDAENQFVGTFKSYCDRHVTGKKCCRPSQNETCCICYENIIGDSGKFNCVTMLRAPCCKNGWFHKWCLAAFAKSAGYFFKCPLCNDNKVFRQRLVYKGVFIPDRDAAWELEPNAFAELLERPKICSAGECIAKGGRTSCNTRNKLVFCGTCGSVAIHRRCMTVQTDNFYCDDCSSIIATVNNASIVNISQQTSSDEEEDVDVDVCADDDDDPPTLSNPQIQDSDEDGGTVYPLGRLKKEGLSIFDDSMLSDDEDDDNEDDIIFEHKVHKRVKRILSSDVESSDASQCVKRNRVASRDAESLFDSGAESDRSGSSGDKLNTNNPSEFPINDSNLSELQKTQATKDVKPKELENLNETKKRVRKFTFLNDIPIENRNTRPSTRRQSEGAEIYLHSLKAKEDMKCDRIHLRRKSALSTLAFVDNAPKTETVQEDILNGLDSPIQLKSQTEIKTTVNTVEIGSSKFNNENVDPPENSFIAHRTRRRSLNLTVDSENIAKKSNARQRTNSEDPSKSSPALERTRRGSFLRSPYSTPPQPGHRRGSSSELLKLVTNKRSRGDSISSNGTTQNKRHKTNSKTDENKNDCESLNMKVKRRPSRGRSPLSSYLCGLYAFLTPAYVKNRDSQKDDKIFNYRYIHGNRTIFNERTSGARGWTNI